jgi:MFS transporter, ACS family, glucarate transporter
MDSQITSRPTTYIRWFLVAWLFVLSAVAYLDRANISIAAAKFSEEFAIGNIRLGPVFSAFLFGYALFQAPAGWLIASVQDVFLLSESCGGVSSPH